MTSKKRPFASAICEATEHTVVVRGKDLCRDLIGKVSFADFFHLLVTGEIPSPAASAVLNATLVALAEHGMVPSVQAARMTHAAAPDAMQAAVAAGVLGCGSVVLGTSEVAGKLFGAIAARVDAGEDMIAAARAEVSALTQAGRAIPGYGHPIHRSCDPRATALFEVARENGADMRYVEIALAVQSVIPEIVGKSLVINVSAAIPAVLLGVGYPLKVMKGVPILARTAGLIGHLAEESERPIGMALAVNAARDLQYDGPTADEKQ